jgi:hypothetical protein
LGRKKGGRFLTATPTWLSQRRVEGARHVRDSKEKAADVRMDVRMNVLAMIQWNSRPRRPAGRITTVEAAAMVQFVSKRAVEVTYL